MAFWNQKKKRKKLIRNLVTLLTVVTNGFIIAGVTRHWSYHKNGINHPVSTTHTQNKN